MNKRLIEMKKLSEMQRHILVLIAFKRSKTKNENQRLMHQSYLIMKLAEIYGEHHKRSSLFGGGYYIFNRFYASVSRSIKRLLKREAIELWTLLYEGNIRPVKYYKLGNIPVIIKATRVNLERIEQAKLQQRKDHVEIYKMFKSL